MDRNLRLDLVVPGWILLLLLLSATMGASQEPAAPRFVLLEVYHRGSDEEGARALAAAREIQDARGGITVVPRDVAEARDRDRLAAVLKHFGLPPSTLPAVYGCNRVVHGVEGGAWATALRDLLTVEVFVRAGCPRCAAAKQRLPSILKDYPGLEAVYRDAAADPAAAARLRALVDRHKPAAASVPVLHVCDTLIVGFEAGGATEARLRSVLKPWTHQPAPASQSRPSSRASRPPDDGGHPPVALRMAWAGAIQTPDDSTTRTQDEGLPLPGGEAGGQAAPDDVELPLFGRLSAGRLGMPLFTIAVGLVDGFNPCAMWVLIFLLSLLVSLGSRARILAVAGTFVAVSGLAYFAFMAAWLNVFVLIGYLRPIQIALAILAILIGFVHVKDFFAFKKGISLSIPESAKAGFYARVRRIVTAEHLAGALAGAITLAVLVNAIELLCTSGLPALYTNILVQRVPSSLARYAYLSLYIGAYMLDDTLMVGVVTVTLSRKKLQESHGRWLKLLSGSAILALGLVMLLRPEWLQ